MSEPVPCCYECLSGDVTIKVVHQDLPDWMCQWFCASCWAGLEAFRARLDAMFSDVTERLEGP